MEAPDDAAMEAEAAARESEVVAGVEGEGAASAKASKLARAARRARVCLLDHVGNGSWLRRKDARERATSPCPCARRVRVRVWV